MEAALYLQRTPAVEQQERVCLEYCDKEHLHVRHVVPYHAPEAATSLVLTGGVEVIVTPYESAAAQTIAADIGDAGQVIAVHPHPHVVGPPHRLPSVSTLVLRWWRAGRTPHEIGVDLDVPSQDIRRIIRRHGEDPN